MRIFGWILTILGCVWAFSGTMRIFLAALGAEPGPGKQLIMGLITLALAALAIWGGGKLRAKATKAKALKAAD
ncbi:hypothetical protein BOO88_08610 [Stutzerimonas stutzeri]|nr:hypothetical protein BOO89_10270 [Stutzerimonas stutzeri]AZO88984.1 hypothetical protein BOO88_08610 [Stutzerimonas stutzeri]